MSAAVPDLSTCFASDGSNYGLPTQEQGNERARLVTEICNAVKTVPNRNEIGQVHAGMLGEYALMRTNMSVDPGTERGIDVHESVFENHVQHLAIAIVDRVFENSRNGTPSEQVSFIAHTLYRNKSLCVELVRGQDVLSRLVERPSGLESAAAQDRIRSYEIHLADSWSELGRERRQLESDRAQLERERRETTQSTGRRIRDYSDIM